MTVRHAAPKPRPSKESSADGVLDIVKTVLFALVVAFVPRVVLCQPYTIPSASMEPTLLVGDYIVVSKFPYGWSRHSIPFSPPLGQGRFFAQQPQRGDIIVFKEPNNGRKDIIKRLVGLPGDTLQVTGGELRINGRAVKRVALPPVLDVEAFDRPLQVAQFRETLPNGKTYVTDSYGPDAPAANTGVYTVPAGCYFMMGDNRDDSLDSRFDPGAIPKGQSRCPWNPALDRFIPAQDEAGMGFVPFDDLVGRAEMVLVSWKPGASLLKPWTWADLRWSRSFHVLGADQRS
jgi:signal peptidase I